MAGRTAAIAEQAPTYRAILDALPIPVWLRDKGLALSWGNHAFLKGAGAADLETARRDQVALDKGERDLAAPARGPRMPSRKPSASRW